MKLKAYELMIFNFVYESGEILLLDKWEFKAHVIDGGCKTLVPIPITESWLKDFGFKIFKEKNAPPIWYIRHYEHPDNEGYNEFHFSLREHLQGKNSNCGTMGIYWKEEKDVPAYKRDNPKHTVDIPESMSNFSWGIQYVHQLQNLYFSLTQKELELNR